MIFNHRCFGIQFFFVEEGPERGMMMMMMMMMMVTTSQVPRFKRQVVAEAGSVGLGKSALPLLGV